MASKREKAPEPVHSDSTRSKRMKTGESYLDGDDKQKSGLADKIPLQVDEHVRRLDNGRISLNDTPLAMVPM